MMRREVRRALRFEASEYEGFPPRFDDPGLTALRARFLVDRERILREPDTFFSAVGAVPCETTPEVRLRLIDPMSVEGGDHEAADFEDGRVMRLEGTCPGDSETQGRLLVTYRIPEDPDGEHDPGFAETIMEGTFRDALIHGPSALYQRVLPLSRDARQAQFLVGYVTLDPVRGVVTAPSVYFRFVSEGLQNYTRAELPLEEGRHRDYFYQGGHLRQTAEWRGFELEGEVVRFAYRNGGGVLMPEERMTYRDGEPVE